MQKFLRLGREYCRSFKKSCSTRDSNAHCTDAVVEYPGIFLPAIYGVENSIRAEILSNRQEESPTLQNIYILDYNKHLRHTRLKLF